jgi:uncharacterized C2H2 Zn-finger protein
MGGQAMSRQAITCPRCGEVLAYARRGGTVVPLPGVALGWLTRQEGTLLRCPKDGCGGLRRVAGRPLISSRFVLHSWQVASHATTWQREDGQGEESSVA